MKMRLKAKRSAGLSRPERSVLIMATRRPNISNEIRLLQFSLTESEVERYLVGGYLTARAIEETIAQARPATVSFPSSASLRTASRNRPRRCVRHVRGG